MDSLRGRAYWKIGCTYSSHIHAVNALSYPGWYVVVSRGSGRGKRRQAQSTIQTFADEYSGSQILSFGFSREKQNGLKDSGSTVGGR